MAPTALAALTLLAWGQLAHAHFGIDYPAPRAVTLGPGRNESYSQWENPCKPSSSPGRQ